MNEPGDRPLSPQDEDWQRFCAVERMVDHWDRPDWWPGREAYYWYLTFDSPELRELTARCQKRLDLPFLDLVPLDGLHLTLPKVGWADETSEADAQLVADQAELALSKCSPFVIQVGPLAGSPGAIRFTVGPRDPLEQLYGRLNSTSPSGKDCMERREFRPHIGIAYCNRSVLAAPLISRVAEMRGEQEVFVDVSQVHLVRLRQVGRAYRWSTLRSIRFI